MKMSISGKCSDCFHLTISDLETYHEHDGYVPSGIGIGDGDYIEFVINVETGQIIGWDADIIKNKLYELMGKDSID